jgi:DNA-binding NarL/FixJ family response regulator
MVLSMLPETLNAETVLNHGARGYIMKSESPDQILDALRKVANGQLYLSPIVTDQLTQKGYFRHE